jgi:hypothetical protein
MSVSISIQSGTATMTIDDASAPCQHDTLKTIYPWLHPWESSSAFDSIRFDPFHADAFRRIECFRKEVRMDVFLILITMHDAWKRLSFAMPGVSRSVHVVCMHDARWFQRITTSRLVFVGVWRAFTCIREPGTDDTCITCIPSST